MYDKDVYINTRIFYKRAGYKYIGINKVNADLIVVLRGNPQNIMYYDGIVHIYDYVKNSTANWKYYFPDADKIFLISLSHYKESLGVLNVFSYLPVIPEFWQKISRNPQSRIPISHIGSYKEIKNDSITKSFVQVLVNKDVKVFGNNWHLVGIKTHGIAHYEANLKFATSDLTLGIMYPYQRGKTLSSRAWHGPIHGCMILSSEEDRVTGLTIPGNHYTMNNNWEESVDYCLSNKRREQIRNEATEFWEKETNKLANILNLDFTTNSRYTELELIIMELKLLPLMKKGKLLLYKCWKALMRSVPVLLVVIFLYISWLNLVCILVTPNFALAL